MKNKDKVVFFDGSIRVTRSSKLEDKSALRPFVDVRVHTTMMLIFGACYFVAHFVKSLNPLELPFVCFMAFFALMMCILVVYGIVKENKEDGKA